MTLEGLALAVAALAVVVLILLVALVLLYCRYIEVKVEVEDVQYEAGLLRTMVLTHEDDREFTNKRFAAVHEVLKRHQTDLYMPCGKEKLSPVEAMLLLTEYMGVEFYGGDGGPCYVSTEHDEVMKKAHKEVIKGEDIRLG